MGMGRTDAKEYRYGEKRTIEPVSTNVCWMQTQLSHKSISKVKPFRTISFDFVEVSLLLDNLHGYWLQTAQKQDMNREEMYRLYLVKKFVDKLRNRQNNMPIDGRMRLKFDAVHSVLMVDVLQRTLGNKATLTVLFQLGSAVPPQMQKV